MPDYLVNVLRPPYHFFMSVWAAFRYGFPSGKIHVIGVTGTSGKSTTIEFLSNILEGAGYVVGSATTIKFKVAEKEWLNDKKMTMVGRLELQRLLKDMVREGCDYAIIETTSEGIKQFRHLGIHYDTLVFTNLHPEHIDSHGSFENYKSAKLRLFKKLNRSNKKRIGGKTIERTIVACIDNEHAKDFLDFEVEKRIGFGLNMDINIDYDFLDETIFALNTKTVEFGIEFEVDGVKFGINIFGEHNVYNALSAIAVGKTQGISMDSMRQSLREIKCVPGRMEFVNEGQDFSVIVDYAFEPVAMRKLYDAVEKIPHSRIIHVLGTTGGGRDADRGEKLGEIAGSLADFVIVTNEDPYDDDPSMLMARVTAGASKQMKNGSFVEIEDRRQAIRTALQSARKGDLVLITGKGSEQGIVVGGGNIVPWDDRIVAIEELKKLINKY